MKRWTIPTLLLAVAAVVHASPTEGVSIGIQVQDIDGTALPGAAVSLQRVPRGDDPSSPDRTCATNQEGWAQLDAIAEGTYLLKVELSGFATTIIGPFYRWNLTTRSSQEQPERLIVVLNPIQVCNGGITVDADGR
jgi:hypothetical protein